MTPKCSNPDVHRHSTLDLRLLRKTLRDYATLMLIGVVVALVAGALGMRDKTSLMIAVISVIVGTMFVRPWRDPAIDRSRHPGKSIPH
jgi:hypothetical protein